MNVGSPGPLSGLLLSTVFGCRTWLASWRPCSLAVAVLLCVGHLGRPPFNTTPPQSPNEHNDRPLGPLWSARVCVHNAFKALKMSSAPTVSTAPGQETVGSSGSSDITPPKKRAVTRDVKRSPHAERAPTSRPTVLPDMPATSTQHTPVHTSSHRTAATHAVKGSGTSHKKALLSPRAVTTRQTGTSPAARSAGTSPKPPSTARAGNTRAHSSARPTAAGTDGVSQSTEGDGPAVASAPASGVSSTGGSDATEQEAGPAESTASADTDSTG